jgi:ABC-type oligopeptide transport system substrate-binding subunit
MKLRRSIVMTIFILTFMLLLGLAGCSQQRKTSESTNPAGDVMVFSGESRNWTVNYTNTIEGGSKSKSKLVLQYKDPDYNTGIVDYTLYENGNKKTVGHIELVEGNKAAAESGGTGALPRNDAKYAIDIAWQNNHEVFPLEYQEN